MNPADSSNPVPVQTLRVDALTVQVYDLAAAVTLASSAIARQILHDAIEARGEAKAIFATGRSRTCPHGRPICLTLKESALPSTFAVAGSLAKATVSNT